MLFGHLSAEDFTNLLEGTSVPEGRRVHLQSCDRCRQRFAATQEMRNQIEEMTAQNEDYIPEPDWSEFRSDVRNCPALPIRETRKCIEELDWSVRV
jgi:predicted anti-sigma-YlaC factor YlaD